MVCRSVCYHWHWCMALLRRLLHPYPPFSTLLFRNNVAEIVNEFYLISYLFQYLDFINYPSRIFPIGRLIKLIIKWSMAFDKTYCWIIFALQYKIKKNTTLKNLQSCYIYCSIKTVIRHCIEISLVGYIHYSI